MARPLGPGVVDRMEIVALYRDGHSTRCVARRIGISQPTVRYHLQAAAVEMRHVVRGRFVPRCCP